MIQLKEVTKKFKSTLAIDHINLDIQQGEVFALLGHNGAGKTTTLNLLMGFHKPDSGEIRVLGRDPYSEGDIIRKDTSFIPEHVNLYPSLSGLENLSYFSQLAGQSYTNAELTEFLNQSGLPSAAVNREMSTYSKGMRQKVGIAIATAKRAKLIVMDEPASGLDPVASKELSQLISKLAKEGTTLVMASHDLFRVKETADRIGIMHQGKLVRILDVSTLTANDLENIYLGTAS